MKVFVSYRRADTHYIAGLLSRRLSDAFGDDSVFFDVRSLHPGTDFHSAIREAIQAVDALLVVIGERFRPARLHEADDILRLEISEALTQGKRVVPVLVEDAEMPSPDDLPPDLEALPRLHASTPSGSAPTPTSTPTSIA